MLEIRDIAVNYGPVAAISSVSLTVPKGSVTTIIGANGAGKSTCLATVSGLVLPQRGEVLFEGQPVTSLTPEQRLRVGIAHVLEGRRLFGDQSVQDNLVLGAYVHRRAKGWRDETARRCEEMYARFPILGTRRAQQAMTLSGGEQMMLAIAVALMSRPKLLLLDEPSLGLAPKMVQAVSDLIIELKQSGVTILLVEQMASLALSVADHAYAFKMGRVALKGTGQELLADMKFHEAYFGAEQAGAESVGP